jgi:hypothetical protein
MLVTSHRRNFGLTVSNHHVRNVARMSTSTLMNFINGTLVGAKDGETVDNINPATLEVGHQHFNIHQCITFHSKLLPLFPLFAGCFKDPTF